ncbi:MAG TPA: rhodanese-like domain-containing protein [Solirubrobacteraceae bacterium]|nr:rhodanese-like domain-containing protein [Solirubrobacteraceae bacterium]
MLPPFISAAALARHLGQVVVCDVRDHRDGRTGRAAYDAGHIPTAVRIEVDRDLSAPASVEDGRHPLPAPKAFAAAMAAAGIGDDDAVIAYDDEGGVMAARLVWMLRVTGHDAAVLDGGIQAWTGPLQTRERRRPTARFAARAWPEHMLAGIDEVAATGDVLLDGRQAERFAGAPHELDPRPGHIPGARGLPTREHVGEDGTLLARDELRRRFAAVGVQRGTHVVSYCGSGVTACHQLLVLEHAGLGPGRLYPGSWSQWAGDPARPAETGA